MRVQPPVHPDPLVPFGYAAETSRTGHLVFIDMLGRDSCSGRVAGAGCHRLGCPRRLVAGRGVRRLVAGRGVCRNLCHDRHGCDPTRRGRIRRIGDVFRALRAATDRVTAAHVALRHRAASGAACRCLNNTAFRCGGRGDHLFRFWFWLRCRGGDDDGRGGHGHARSGHRFGSHRLRRSLHDTRRWLGRRSRGNDAGRLRCRFRRRRWRRRFCQRWLVAADGLTPARDTRHPGYISVNSGTDEDAALAVHILPTGIGRRRKFGRLAGIFQRLCLSISQAARRYDDRECDGSSDFHIAPTRCGETVPQKER